MIAALLEVDVPQVLGDGGVRGELVVGALQFQRGLVVEAFFKVDPAQTVDDLAALRPGRQGL
jgi:hypothetical protein